MPGLPAFRARALAPFNQETLLADLHTFGLDGPAAAVAASHATGRVLRLEGLPAPVVAAITVQAGAVGASVVRSEATEAGHDGTLHSVDVLLLGSAAQLLAMADRLGSETVRGPVAVAIREALAARTRPPGVLQLGRHRLDLSRRVAVMAIVNATPDSFFAGGRFTDPQAAVAYGLRAVAEGADILDVGGDSANGAARPIDAAEEIQRVVPVIRELARQVDVPIAVDTHRAATAAAALDAGASMVNDITGLSDPQMGPVVAHGDAGVCVMHIRGRPKEFPPDFQYRSLLGEVIDFLAERTGVALAAGVGPARIVVDPGIEFGKLLHQDLELLRRLPELGVLGYPVLVAVSRKDFVGNVLGLPPEERLEGTAASVAFAISRGARIVRVHDVQAMARVARMAAALSGYQFGADSGGQRRSDGVDVAPGA